MTLSLMLRIDEPRLEAIYTWLEQRGSSSQLFGREADQRAALLAYGDGHGDPFGWANWMTKMAQDPSSLLPAFEQLEIVADEADASALNAAFPGAFNIGAPHLSAGV
jgi:hypothetical protein